MFADKESYVIAWEFLARPGEEAAFEAAYGPAGDWAQFFRRDPRYIGTELARDIEQSRRYLTLDFWVSRRAYEDFRTVFRDEYDALDHRCESLTEHETSLGTFLTVYPATGALA